MISLTVEGTFVSSPLDNCRARNPRHRRSRVASSTSCTLELFALQPRRSCPELPATPKRRPSSLIQLTSSSLPNTYSGMFPQVAQRRSLLMSNDQSQCHRPTLKLRSLSLHKIFSYQNYGRSHTVKHHKHCLPSFLRRSL